MASNKNSSSNRTEVPEARDAMDRFKMEVADEPLSLVDSLAIL